MLSDALFTDAAYVAAGDGTLLVILSTVAVVFVDGVYE
jgi:hypothetical protein